MLSLLMPPRDKLTLDSQAIKLQVSWLWPPFAVKRHTGAIQLVLSVLGVVVDAATMLWSSDLLICKASTG
jgi:hypothetical protein